MMQPTRTEPKPLISSTAITSLVLGVLGLIVVAFLAPVLKVLGVLLAVAAVLVGVLGGVNARRQGTSPALCWIGAGLGLVAALYALVYFLTWNLG